MTNLTPERYRQLDGACDTFELAWQQGQRPRIEDHLAGVLEELRGLLRDELIRMDLEWRCRQGEQPVAGEYSTRFPACADALDDWLAEARTAADSLREEAQATDQLAAATLSQNGSSPTPVQEEAPLTVRSPGKRPLRELGEYELLAPLGHGGMGEVWKARHRRLGKLVALKLLLAGRRQSPQAAERFLREMKALGQLDHPHVVEASDAGECEGTIYLVMKLVEGRDLAKVVQERGPNPMPIADACEYARQTALGLQYLHEHGLIHRDLKPSNLMLTPSRLPGHERGLVKILDLGLARWRSEATTADDLTGPGLLGTPDFLAPEQALEAATVDIRADLYALGGTLFCLLTGRAPFAHHTGAFQKVTAHTQEPAPDVRTLRPDVPAELAQLLARLLAKRPADRPQTPAEVAAALAVFAAPAPAETPALAATMYLPERAAPHRRWVAWAGATAALVAVGLLLLPYLSNRPNQPAPSSASAATSVPVVPTSPLQVLGIQVTHYALVKFNGKDALQPLGILGKASFAPRLHDRVTVEARLSRPAYAFVIAFRADGTEEMCFPDSEDEAPALTERPRYPSATRDAAYGLDEGAGLWAFTVVASSQPLPSYKTWRAQRGPAPWGKHAAPPHIVWFDDGALVETWSAKGVDRGKAPKGLEVPGRTPLVQLTDWLKQGQGVEIAGGVAFAVQPGGEP